MFPSPSPELHASVDHGRTRIRAAAVASGVSSGLIGTWIFARERADQMLASKIVEALVPSAQAFDTAERRGRPRHRREAQGASFAGANESNAATKFAAEDSGHYNCWMKGGNWKTISSERRFADRNLEVVTDRVQTPARPAPRAWTIVHRKPAVIVAPMTRDGKIILIRQERIPIGQAIWEMPSGQIDDRNSDEDKIKDTVSRELREETGYELAPNGELISLGYFFSSPGFTDERGYFFLARPVQPCADGPDRDEGESILDCRGFTSEEIRRMIADNEIRDANTLGICATLAARGLLSLAPR